MVSWKALGPDFSDEAWDKAVLSLPDHCVFQSSAWARHKRASGWDVLRLAAGPEGRPRAAAQFLTRRYPGGVRLLWSRGGPLGDVAAWGALREALPGAPSYARICSYRPLGEETPPGLLRDLGWRKPARALNRNSTFLLDLSVGEDALRARLSSNWGHNLRRALKRCPEPRRWENARGAELLEVYRSMEGYKGVRAPYGAEELESLLSSLGQDALLYRLDDEKGSPVALRACAVQGGKAWDLLAASSEAGRKTYASYALLWALLRRCLERGVREYDLGGADPVGAKGVYDFKKGTGARFVEYLGEWDWASPRLLRLPVSFIAGGRGA